MYHFQCEAKGPRGFISKLHKDIVLQPIESFKLLIPAALYTVQSNLIYIAVSNLGATTFMVS